MDSRTVTRPLRAGALALAVVIAFGACASRTLAERPIEGEPLRLTIRIAPDARVQASYSVKLDAEDPVGSLLSIGTAAAKASQVERAQRAMDSAMRNLDVRAILDEELGGFFADQLEMPIVSATRDASYLMIVEVREYGIDAGGPGSSVRFVLRGRAELHETDRNDRIWRNSFSSEAPISPEVFGLPGAAGNVLSAAMLSELTEEQIEAGLERVARGAAWDVGWSFQDDLYRARRRR